MVDEKDGVKVTLFVVACVAAGALASVLFANHVVRREVERVVQEAQAKEEQRE